MVHQDIHSNQKARWLNLHNTLTPNHNQQAFHDLLTSEVLISWFEKCQFFGTPFKPRKYGSLTLFNMDFPEIVLQ